MNHPTTNSVALSRRLNRRAVLRGSVLGATGLAAAALIGCGGSSDEDDAGPTLAELRARRAAGSSGATSTDGHAPAATNGHAAPAATDGHAAPAATDGHAAPAADGHATAADDHEAPHWGYSGDGGPEHWDAIDPDFAVCSVGRNQSPINIAHTTSVGAGNVGFHYQHSSLTVVNNGHTIQANLPPGNDIDVDGKAFGLLQFHFHAPSEHTLDGHNFPLEMHLVHRDSEGNLGVVGVFFQDGAADQSLAAVFDHMPHSTTEQRIVEGFDVASLLPIDHSMYRYAGSLTTPPCTEGVRWMLMQSPRSASAAQVEAFSSLFGANNRPLQPQWAREVLEEGSASTVAHQ